MKLQVIVGGQFGSEAKGHIAGYLANQSLQFPVMAVRVAGPNAGHSVVNPKTGVKHALRQVPVAAVTNPTAALCIAAGSEVDLAVLFAELDALDEDGIDARYRLKIDPAATILTEHDVTVARTVDMLKYMPSRSLVQVEGTQGYGLGLHTKYYPQTTSSDCRAIDFLAMAGMSPWWFDETEIWVVVRPYPIRVAGNSGPLSNETTWEALGLPEERTTVTKKIRRVGTWDRGLVRRAIEENGGYGTEYLARRGDQVHLAFTMADQLDPEIAGRTEPTDITQKVAIFLNLVRTDTGYTPELVTTSDRTVIDLR